MAAALAALNHDFHRLPHHRASAHRRPDLLDQVHAFAARASVGLDAFADEADHALTVMEDGSLNHLADFEHAWDVVQHHLVTRLKRLGSQAAATKKLASVSAHTSLSAAQDYETLSDTMCELDDVIHKIDCLSLNACDQAKEALSRLRQLTTDLRAMTLET